MVNVSLCIKCKFSKIVPVTVFSFFIIPQVIFAAWWNPFTWNIFNANKTPAQQVQMASTTTTMQTTSTVTTTIPTSITPPTTKVISKPVIKKPDQSIAKVAISKYPNFSAAVDTFFTTPNITTLKGVCEQSKSVNTGETKDVLSSDKLMLQKIPYSLYDEFKEMCGLLDRDDIKVGNATPDAFSMVLTNDDSDSVRIAKLKSNDFMKIPNSYAVFYFYSADSQEKKYINDDLLVSCPPKDAEHIIATDKATHKIYAPVIYLLGKLSSSRMIDILGIELSAIGKSRLSKTGVGWTQNIPFYGICFK